MTSFDGMQAGVSRSATASILFEPHRHSKKKLAEIEEEKKAAQAEQKPAVELPARISPI